MSASPPPYPPQPYPYGPPPSPPKPEPADPGALFRLLGGILGAPAALLVLAGSFLPQTSFEQIVGDKTESSQTISAWSRSFTVEPGDEARKFYENTHVAHYGIPLTVGAVVLLLGAGLAFAAARRTAGAGVRSGARTALLAGGAAVTAAVWMLAMDVSATLSYESDDGSLQSHYATGTGFWMLLGGGVVALVVLACAVLAGRRGGTRAGSPPGPYGGPAYGRPAGPPPQQSGGYPVSQPFPVQAGGPYPPQQPWGGPQSQPFAAQPFAAPPSSAPPSSAQPSSAQPSSAQPSSAQPFAAGPPADAEGVTQVQPHPGQQPDGLPEPASPTEPNYQLPPLNPPKT
jgi:hypothetical protein